MTGFRDNCLRGARFSIPQVLCLASPAYNLSGLALLRIAAQTPFDIFWVFDYSNNPFGPSDKSFCVSLESVSILLVYWLEPHSNRKEEPISTDRRDLVHIGPNGGGNEKRR